MCDSCVWIDILHCAVLEINFKVQANISNFSIKRCPYWDKPKIISEVLGSHKEVEVANLNDVGIAFLNSVKFHIFGLLLDEDFVSTNNPIAS